MNPRRLWERVQGGAIHNIDFKDFVNLVQAFGFQLERHRGSHEIYRHPQVEQNLNLQPLRDGSAKPYQVRELVALVKTSRLTLDTEEDH